MPSGKNFKRCYLHYITFYITSHPRVSIITLSCGGCKSRTLLDNTLQLCLHRLRYSFHICMNVASNLQSVIRPPTSDHQSNFFSFELISLFIMTNKKTRSDIVFFALGLGPRPFLDFSKRKNYLSTGDLDVSRHLAVPALSTYIQWKMEDDHTWKCMTIRIKFNFKAVLQLFHLL